MYSNGKKGNYKVATKQGISLLPKNASSSFVFLEFIKPSENLLPHDSIQIPVPVFSPIQKLKGTQQKKIKKREKYGHKRNCRKKGFSFALDTGLNQRICLKAQSFDLEKRKSKVMGFTVDALWALCLCFTSQRNER